MFKINVVLCVDSEHEKHQYSASRRDQERRKLGTTNWGVVCGRTNIQTHAEFLREINLSTTCVLTTFYEQKIVMNAHRTVEKADDIQCSLLVEH